MPAKNFHVRQAAVSALRAWAKGQDYAESLIERHASRRQLGSSDRKLLQAILYTVLRNRSLLDHWISKLRKGKLDPETRDVLRVGLCQTLLLGLPDHAAVNETVEAGKAAVRGLINAVLRRSIQMREQLLAEVDKLPAPIAHSHPEWLYKRWKNAYGKSAALELMKWDNLPSAVTFRTNPLAPPIEGELPGSPVEGAEDFYRLKGKLPRDLLASGSIYIQDPATRHCVELLEPKAGEAVLDACAAPGGKAFLIGAAMGTGATLTCTDSNPKRLPRLKDNLERLHLGDATIQEHDWTQAAPSEWHEAFDAILLDVPCSNTGVIRRRVDVRWRLKPLDIETIRETQLAILNNALACLRPGGRIVYSTCSIEDSENRDLVREFLELHPDLHLVNDRRILPFEHQTDGAYAARIERKA
ncbi:MAG: transcription antitermination factor NusB [Akkermansiaceae bacterium]|nr:transcription antitermination factor NusB [Akkermansiaceae bacterium]